MKASLVKSSAYKAGEGLTVTIVRESISIGAVKQIQNIMKNHPDDALKSFLEGLLGLNHA